MRTFFILLAVVMVAACGEKQPEPQVADTAVVRGSRYILISGVTSPGSGCESTGGDMWRCPATQEMQRLQEKQKKK